MKMLVWPDSETQEDLRVAEAFLGECWSEDVNSVQARLLSNFRQVIAALH